MKNIILALLAIGAIALGGCAVAPQKIKPQYVSELGYLNYTETQLVQEQARVVTALAAACAAQRRAREGDTAGVIFLGLPVSSLAGDNQAAYIARLKGEWAAIRQAATTLGRTLPQLADPSLKAEPETIYLLPADQGKNSD